MKFFNGRLHHTLQYLLTVPQALSCWRTPP